MSKTILKREQWHDKLFSLLKSEEIKQISFVPDAGHSKLIEMAIADSQIKAIALTSEEEGVSLSCGAWLGGQKSVLLMQSSGVGNCINMFSILKSCDFPFLTFITMRGEYEEFNSWQLPMGSTSQACLELMGFEVTRIDRTSDIVPTTRYLLENVFSKNLRCAVLLSQRLIGKKRW